MVAAGVLLAGDWSQVIFSNTNGIQVTPVIGTGPVRTLESSHDLFPAPEADRFVTADAHNRFSLWSTNGPVSDVGFGRGVKANPARQAAFTRDGRLLATGGEDGSGGVRRTKAEAPTAYR